MNKFRATINIRSPLLTPLMNDTLLGHICWGITNHEGEESLNAFFEEYDKGKPPLIVSNAFFGGMLPVPKIKPSLPNLTASMEEIGSYKDVKKLKSIPFQCYEQPISQKMMASIVDNTSPIIKNDDRIVSTSKNRNVINRFTGTTGDNSLYSVSEYWYGNPKEGNFSDDMEIYIFTEYDEKRVLELLSWAFEFGYGADASVGYGRIELSDDSIEPVEFDVNGNRAVALGNFVLPMGHSVKDLWSDIVVKHGKLGGYLSQEINPFKKPIVMFTEGSTFVTEDKIEYIGTVLKNVHSDSRIRHFAYAPVIYYNEEVADES